MISSLVSRLVILVFGNLYPAYASYKAVRTRNVKEYVKWMMYWIVFAFFTCIETCTDIFLSWFPFYYEIKVLIVVWLLSPATKGSSTLYRKFVHPMLTRREQEIDEYLNQAKERGYSAVLQLGSKGVNYATSVIMQTAIKGGGNLVQSIRRSYSLSDLSEPDLQRTEDELDDLGSSQRRLLRHRHALGRSSSSSGTRHSTGMYFTEVELNTRAAAGDLNCNVKALEDSSGYSSQSLSRTSSLTNASKSRLKGKRNELTSSTESLALIEALQLQNSPLSINELPIEADGDMKSSRIVVIYKDASPLSYGNLSDYLKPTKPINEQEEKEAEFITSESYENLTINSTIPLFDNQSNTVELLKEQPKVLVIETSSNTVNFQKTTNDESSEDDDVFMDTISAQQLEDFVEKPKLSPNRLRLSLQEINDSFQKSIQSSTTSLNSNNSKQKHLYNKGRAPSPPRPQSAETPNNGIFLETDV